MGFQTQSEIERLHVADGPSEAGTRVIGRTIAWIGAWEIQDARQNGEWTLVACRYLRPTKEGLVKLMGIRDDETLDLLGTELTRPDEQFTVEIPTSFLMDYERQQNHSPRVALFIGEMASTKETVVRCRQLPFPVRVR